MVECSDLKTTVVHIPYSILLGWAQPDGLVVVNLADPINAAFEFKLAAVVRTACFKTGTVLVGSLSFFKAAYAGLIATCGYVELERFVWSRVVVNGPPWVKTRLAFL